MRPPCKGGVGEGLGGGESDEVGGRGTSALRIALFHKPSLSLSASVSHTKPGSIFQILFLFISASFEGAKRDCSRQ